MKWSLLTFVLLLSLASWLVYQQVYQKLNLPLQVSGSSLLVVPRGATLTSVAEELRDRQLLHVPVWLVRAFARLTDSGGSIKAGEYELAEVGDLPGLLLLLRSGRVVQRQITFAEGWTTEQWLDHLEAQLHIEFTPREVLQQQFGMALEGRFFPDTYSYIRDESSLLILSRAANRMQDVLNREWQSRSAQAAVATPAEALVLSSIVEKETGHPDDRGAIAGVFSNRLELNMKLQSDPTVIYGLEDFDGNLTRPDLQVDHPYNTYVHRGLPVGPICNPGAAAIHAALHPEISDKLYFVARGDGRSYFSRTLDEHNAAVARYQKAGRVKNYRSAPD